jgi:hypothetical protein
MKKLKLSISDNYGNIDLDGSPLWGNNSRYSWREVEFELGLESDLVERVKLWQKNSIRANQWIGVREERVRCEIEGLTILLELRRELPDFEITYYSIFSGSYFVLNKEQEDD